MTSIPPNQPPIKSTKSANMSQDTMSQVALSQVAIPQDTKLQETVSPNDAATLTKDHNVDFNSSLVDPTKLAKAYTGAIKSAKFKSKPQDFIVNECMDIAFSGQGEHLWLCIKKTGMNTAYVAKLLSKWAGIAQKDIGLSGQKDRLAVTTQWFSLRLPTQQLPSQSFEAFIEDQSVSFSKPNDIDNATTQEKVEIIDQQWHSKKLNRGTHKSNEFIITLREVVGSKQEIESLLQRIATEGVPNYFGEQRFGKHGNNLVHALEWLQTGKAQGRRLHPKRNRDQISMLISASRSVIFNQILAQRVSLNTWNTGINGDVFNLAGTGAIFASTVIDDVLLNRVQSADIHPTGALWGINNDKIHGDAKALELATINDNSILQALAHGLETNKIKAARRALRMMISELNWTWQDDATLTLKFMLPTGSYATSVIMALMQ